MEVKIIGQDKLITRELYPRIRKRVPFVVVGQRGIGKSSMLKWAYTNYQGEKIYISCRTAYGHILRKIAERQGSNGTGRKRLGDIETDVIKGKKVAIFLDDIERATPKLIGLLTSLNETWEIYMAGVEPFREELKRVLWGKKKVRVSPIDKQERLKLAAYCIQETGTRVDRNTIAVESRGVPGRAWAIARGEPLKEDSERVEGEEINIAPVLLIVVAAVMILRYVGLGMGEKDLYVLGGIGMGAAIFIRYFFYEAMKK